MNKEEIIRRLNDLPYDRETYWLLYEAAKVMHGLRKGAGVIVLGCSSEMADRLEAEGFLEEGYRPDEGVPEEMRGKARATRQFRICEDVFAVENMMIGGWMEELDGFQVADLSALKAMDDRELRSHGLDPDMMRETETEHYVFHYLEGSFAEKNIREIAVRQEQGFRRICDAVRAEPDFLIHYYLLNNPFEVGRFKGGNKAINCFLSYPDTIASIYNDRMRSNGVYLDAQLISRLIGEPGSNAVQQGLAMFFEGIWWNQPILSWTVFYRNTGRLPKIEELLDNDIIRIVPQYISLPVLGEFTRWLIDTFGMEKYLAFYPLKDSAEGLRMAYQHSAEELGQKFLEFTRRYDLPKDAMTGMEEIIQRYGMPQGKVQ